MSIFNRLGLYIAKQYKFFKMYAEASEQENKALVNSIIESERKVSDLQEKVSKLENEELFVNDATQIKLICDICGKELNVKQSGSFYHYTAILNFKVNTHVHLCKTCFIKADLQIPNLDKRLNKLNRKEKDDNERSI